LINDLADDEKLRNTSDKLTTDFISERDERNTLISTHHDLVETFGNTVSTYNDSLRKEEQSRKTCSHDRNMLQR
jgi:hypothetical protein